jgi:hypothetical protein
MEWTPGQVNDPLYISMLRMYDVACEITSLFFFGWREIMKDGFKISGCGHEYIYIFLSMHFTV